MSVARSKVGLSRPRQHGCFLQICMPLKLQPFCHQCRKTGTTRLLITTGIAITLWQAYIFDNCLISDCWWPRYDCEYWCLTIVMGQSLYCGLAACLHVIAFFRERKSEALHYHDVHYKLAHFHTNFTANSQKEPLKGWTHCGMACIWALHYNITDKWSIWGA